MSAAVRKNATIKDIAKAAGVAVSTVSYALNNAPGSRVSAGKRQEILQIASALGYRPNQAAKSLILRKSYRVGVMFSTLSGHSYSLLIESIQRELSLRGYSGICASWGATYDLLPFQKMYDNLLNASVDGMIIAHSDFRPFDPKIPTVIYGQMEGKGLYDTFVRETARIVTPCAEYLRDLGHRKVAVMCHRIGRHEEDVGVMHSYFPEFCDEYLFAYLDTVEGGGEVLRRIMTIPAERRPTAIIMRGDDSALGLYMEAQKLGVRIPEDLSVIGTTNLPESEFLYPPLTTVNWNRDETSRILVEMLMSRMNNPDLPYRYVAPEQDLLIRESATKI